MDGKYLKNKPLGFLKWVQERSQFNEDFTKSQHEDSDEGNYLEDDVQYPENLHNLHDELLFSPERMKIEKFEKLLQHF